MVENCFGKAEKSIMTEWGSESSYSPCFQRKNTVGLTVICFFTRARVAELSGLTYHKNLSVYFTYREDQVAKPLKNEHGSPEVIQSISRKRVKNHCTLDR